MEMDSQDVCVCVCVFFSHFSGSSAKPHSLFPFFLKRGEWIEIKTENRPQPTFSFFKKELLR